MPNYHFGTGYLWGTPLTDATNTTITTPTPVMFGEIQDVSIDISFDAKELYGQVQFPLAIRRGKGKIAGKAKFARLNGLLLNSLFFGQTTSASSVLAFADTVGALIPSTPFQITPTVPGSGTWSADLGVKDSNGNPMTAVASGPTTGQYSVATGIYTFAVADVGKTVFISYRYTATSTASKTSIVTNQIMGSTPTFRADFVNGSTANANGFTSLSLFSCVTNKFTFQPKLDDFGMDELDFVAQQDSVGRVLQWGTSE